MMLSKCSTRFAHNTVLPSLLVMMKKNCSGR
jgi:hypothetical protein